MCPSRHIQTHINKAEIQLTQHTHSETAGRYRYNFVRRADILVCKQTHLDTTDTCVCLQTHSDTAETFRYSMLICFGYFKHHHYQRRYQRHVSASKAETADTADTFRNTQTQQAHVSVCRHSRHMCLQPQQTHSDTSDTFMHIQTQKTYVSACRHIQTHLDTVDTYFCLQPHSDTRMRTRMRQNEVALSMRQSEADFRMSQIKLGFGLSQNEPHFENEPE